MQDWIYDIIIAAVLLLFTWRGWKKGLLLSLCGLVVVIAAYFGAGFLADTLDDPVADALAPKLETTIQSVLEKKAEEIGLEGHFSNGDASDTLRDMGGLYQWAADHVEEALRSSVSETISQQASAAADAVALKLAHSVIFILSFLVLMVLLTLLLHALDLVAKLPGLSFCNGLGGGIIGLLKGGLILLVVLSCLRLFTQLIPAQGEENTYLLRFFLRFDPFSPFLKA